MKDEGRVCAGLRSLCGWIGAWVVASAAFVDGTLPLGEELAGVRGAPV